MTKVEKILYICTLFILKPMDIKRIISESISVKQHIIDSPTLNKTIEEVTNLIIATYRKDGAVYFCGNGGSAADAQHIAAELSGRFYYDRPPLAAEALHVNTSYLTAVANDYSYDEIYARYIKGAGRKGDVLVGISTSGNSKNIIRAFEVAKEKGITTVALTGESGGNMKNIADFVINVPSSDTPRIQESHIMIGHIICQFVESELFPK
jgi:D-sedoheptulose 7-phosphate isomerase